jgi:hypothetical protein
VETSDSVRLYMVDIGSGATAVVRAHLREQGTELNLGDREPDVVEVDREAFKQGRPLVSPFSFVRAGRRATGLLQLAGRRCRSRRRV